MSNCTIYNKNYDRLSTQDSKLLLFGWGEVAVEPQRSSKTYPDYREEREQSVQVKKMDFGVRLHVVTSLCCCSLPV